ncbi:unnamed protein product [Rotaria socialis]|uniref:Uncharacterized protein n=1 Tax=Rotaria socialis TaxID=392032 RepID=A0A817NBZ5_9BILA|nr:unnamed protein product [Rotaria socialis]CAF3337319.1 unnamed protein product [Rotaria socialis]CAF3538480.1 unnamed protein product [Rotaria socialis]CAF3697887.1 unnamed protein product [Rotaria socialis]CAF3730602.1 unnamed protein product [Rotaria socialis]
MDTAASERSSETTPLSRENTEKSIIPIHTVSQTFGTTYFLVSALLASIIPIIQLSIGLYFKGMCPIDQRIPTYMIVAGSCGLALAGLTIFLAITFKCLIADSTAMNIVGSCGVCLNVLATVLISIFLFIWFIFGCVWVFNIRSEVQFKDKSSGNYCNAVLYEATFVLLIISIIWAFLQCCFSCFRQCCSTGRD